MRCLLVEIAKCDTLNKVTFNTNFKEQNFGKLKL